MSAVSATAPTGIPVIGVAEMEAALDRAGAVAAIEAALHGGVDIEADAPRLFSPLTAGEFLLMPSQSPQHAGIKVVTIAPANPARDLPKIQAWYLLFEAETLAPVAILEGAHLTLLRTPAVTAVAVRALLAADPAGPRGIATLAVLGSGPQAEAHVRTLADLMPVGEVLVLGRTPDRAEPLVARLRDTGFAARAATRADLAAADVVIAATSSAAPVVARADVADNAVVAAIGTHGADHRELAADLVLDGDLVVEARASAFRENGNLLAARTADQWRAGAQPVTNLRELVTSPYTRRPGHPAVYTGVGMSWEDLAVVARILGRADHDDPSSSRGASDGRE